MTFDPARRFIVDGMPRYTIGEVALRSGFPATTLRYYEDHGLVAPADRTDAGYRIYDDTTLDRLEFIARAKQLGCTLEEIADLVALWDGEDCAPVQRRLHELVTGKIDDAQTRSAELIRFTAQLRSAAARLDADPVDGPCGEGCACLAEGIDRADETDGVQVGASPEIACTLTADAMFGRVDDWQAFLAHVVRRSGLPGVGLRLELAPDAPLHELARLMVAEQRCCTFFAFRLTVDDRGSALEVRAPADAQELVTAVFGTAAA